MDRCRIRDFYLAIVSDVLDSFHASVIKWRNSAIKALFFNLYTNAHWSIPLVLGITILKFFKFYSSSNKLIPL